MYIHAAKRLIYVMMHQSEVIFKSKVDQLSLLKGNSWLDLIPTIFNHNETDDYCKG